MKIWVNTIVNNEDKFIWFALMSIVDYVEKILVWDTGSTDQTVKIIQAIKKKKKEKIIFKEIGKIDPQEVSALRQKMLEHSNCDWIILLDGDEIWWDASIRKLINKIKSKGQNIDAVVVPVVVPVGDIYHFQEEAAGQYKILGKKGHLNLRAINRKIPGLHVSLPHPQEGYFDRDNILIQERKGTIFLDSPYLHMTHLKRSSVKRDTDKFKHELGNKVSAGFKYPEVLYKPFPSPVSSPWVKLSGLLLIKSTLLTPLRKIKRRMISLMEDIKQKLESGIWRDNLYYQMAKEGSLDMSHPGMRILQQLASNAHKILDLGCGEGSRLKILAKNKVALGIDISQVAINMAKKKYPKIKFIKADLERIPIVGENFDLVYSAYVLEHSTNPEKILSEAIRLASDDGYLVLIAPNYGAPNRCSPVFKGSRINKLLAGFMKDWFNFEELDKLGWMKVIPIVNKNKYDVDFDTTVEPYIRSLISFLKSKGMTISRFNSCWDQELPNSRIHQKFFRLLGQWGIYPFNFWGPHLVVVAQK